MKEILFKIVRIVFGHYEGKIEETNDELILSNNNIIGDGKKVLCKLSVGLLSGDYPYYVDGDEKTCSILGGFGYPCESITEVVKIIKEEAKRYNFAPKEQMSLFDFSF